MKEKSCQTLLEIDPKLMALFWEHWNQSWKCKEKKLSIVFEMSATQNQKRNWFNGFVEKDILSFSWLNLTCNTNVFYSIIINSLHNFTHNEAQEGKY